MVQEFYLQLKADKIDELSFFAQVFCEVAVVRDVIVHYMKKN